MKGKCKVVLVGGTGFIGEYLSASLSKKNISLSVISKNPPLQNRISNNKSSTVKYFQIDAANDGQKFGEVIKNADCLVLLNQPEKKVLENLIEFGSGVKKIVYASTILLYEDSNIPLSETSPLNPTTDYDQTKFEEENILSEYAKKQNIILSIARLSNVYGDIKNRGIVQKIFSSILNNKKFIINGDGNQKRDYIFVEDVVLYLEDLILLSENKPIDIFNICTGDGTTINELISNIEKVTKKKLLYQKGPSIKEKKVLIGDNQKIIELTGKKPFYNLEDGLKKAYQNNLK